MTIKLIKIIDGTKLYHHAFVHMLFSPKFFPTDAKQLIKAEKIHFVFYSRLNYRKLLIALIKGLVPSFRQLTILDISYASQSSIYFLFLFLILSKNLQKNMTPKIQNNDEYVQPVRN